MWPDESGVGATGTRPARAATADLTAHLRGPTPVELTRRAGLVRVSLHDARDLNPAGAPGREVRRMRTQLHASGARTSNHVISQARREELAHHGRPTSDADVLSADGLPGSVEWATIVWRRRTQIGYLPLPRAATSGTVVAVYTGSPDEPVEVACNSDRRHTRLAAVTWQSEPGEPYWVQVGGSEGQSGRLSMALTAP